MGKVHDALEKVGKNIDQRFVEKVDRHAGKKSNAEFAALKKIVGQGVQQTNNGFMDPSLIAYHHPSSGEAEIFKILRSNIIFPKEGSPPRTIMVTSALPGDGKSFVASNLAISIAQGIEEHVLLMDCDMRRSTIHMRFGMKDDVRGLSDCLSQRRPLSSVLQKTAVDKLTILPGGKPPANPSELLSSQMMRFLLEEVKNRYSDRYIILDSPPPQLTAETTALANYIDGIIVVVKYGTSPKEMVKDLVKKLGQEKILGVVMNGYRIPVTERYSYGRYKQYYRQY